jgi:hypothetical protein
MQSRTKQLISLVIVLAVAGALAFALFQPAQTSKYPPLPTVCGWVTYSHQNCEYTDYDTVRIRPKGGTTVAKTTVYLAGRPPRQHYEYDFGEFLESAGYYEITGLQGTCGCTTDIYEIYFDGLHTVRQDIDFSIAPLR